MRKFKVRITTTQVFEYEIEAETSGAAIVEGGNRVREALAGTEDWGMSDVEAHGISDFVYVDGSSAAGKVRRQI